MLKQAGDTIVEVLFAITVFSLLAVGAIAIMNQGTATAQKSLEISLVRQQIDAQAAAIRYIHDSYTTDLTKSSGGQTTDDWTKMASTVSTDGYAKTKASSFTLSDEGGCSGNLPSGAFILNAHSGRLVDDSSKIASANDANATPFSQVVYDATDSSILQHTYGLWVESVRQSNRQNYVDFHIRACWYAPGSPQATTLGTIVRLYVPV